jgi:2'-5' RNA ligase
MRLFIAVNLSDESRRAIDVMVAPIRSDVPSIRWVATEMLHITVKFIGEQSGDAAARVGDVLKRVGQSAPTEVCVFAGIGAFPNFRRPRVVWMGVRPPALAVLATSIDRALVPLGIPAEGRPFTPHLTLGRVARGLHPGELARLRGYEASVGEVSRMQVSSIELMRSQPARGGSSYTALVTAPLDGSQVAGSSQIVR